MSKMHDLVYGELDGTVTPRIQALDAQLQGAGFNAQLSPHIERDMWEKWTMLASLAGITCLMRGTVGEIKAVRGGAAFALRFVDEVNSVVKAVGQPPRAAHLETVQAMVTQKGAPRPPRCIVTLSKGRLWRPTRSLAICSPAVSVRASTRRCSPPPMRSSASTRTG